MGHHLIKEVAQEKFVFTGRSKMVTIILMVVGIGLAGFGAMQVKSNWGQTDDHHSTEEQAVAHEAEHADADTHEAEHVDANHADEHAEASHGHEKLWTARLWSNILMNGYYFLLFSVGALFFLAVNYLANSGWATMIKRISEAMSSFIIFGLAAVFITLYFAKDQLYHWVAYFSEGHVKGDSQYDKILESKAWLLNTNFLMVIVPLVIVVWYLFRMKFRRNSIKEDAEGG